MLLSFLLPAFYILYLVFSPHLQILFTPPIVQDEEASARFYYPRLWIYPNQIMLSERVMSLCMSLREKEMSSSL